MRQDASTLQQRLDALLRIAKSNERKQDNFQQYELSLLSCGSLSALLELILEQHQQRFQLTEVTLLLYDPEYAFQRLLADTPDAQWQHKLLFTDSLHTLDQFFNLQRTPRLSTFEVQKHAGLFPAISDLGSVALLPLIRQQQLIGCLNLGSRNPSRFQAGIGTQFLQHMAAVVAACIENARLHEEIKLVGLRDPLTGVNNRRFFDQRIEEEVSRAKRQKTPLSCLFVDLDHFKRVNDQHGHQAGDLILKQVANLINDSLRSTDVLSRYGGEEFVILLTDTDTAAAADIARRMREHIAAMHFIVSHGRKVQITLSIGLATLNINSPLLTSKQLLKAADQAVYAAKISGRNCVHQAG
ncbi:MAG: sensor domain-containing diguanylate cyclase [Methylophaga sp.]